MTIYPPEHHTEMIVSLYENIGFNPEIGWSDTIISPDTKKSVFSVETNLDNHTADISITTYGKNILDEVHRVMEDLLRNQTATVYLRLKLVDPFTAKYTASFEKMGYIFAGILPKSNDNDVLILQYLNKHVIDFDQLKIASKIGKEILAYVRKYCKSG